MQTHLDKESKKNFFAGDEAAGKQFCTEKTREAYEAYSRALVEKYGDDLRDHAIDHVELWKISKCSKTSYIYGIGSSDLEYVVTGKSSTASCSSSSCESQHEVNELRIKLDTVEKDILLIRAVNEPNGHERRLVHVCSFNFKRYPVLLVAIYATILASEFLLRREVNINTSLLKTNMGNILMQKYEFGKMLGQGNFAKVYHGRDLKSGQSIAIKVIDKEKVLKVGLIDQTKREISVMKTVKHPNIIQLYEVMATKTKIYFAMEYAKGGELFEKVSKGRLKEDVARKYFQQLILAVDHCHSRGVYHRDLKPENLLLDENGDLKVTDFGLSAHDTCTRLDGLFHTTCGTPAYVAPEVISRRGYDGGKSDIWSCGVILFVLLTGNLPFNDSNIIQMYRKITKADYKCPNWVTPETRRLLKKILDPNPLTRISIKKIMENPWFKRGLDTKLSVEQQTDVSVILPAIPELAHTVWHQEPKKKLDFTFTEVSSFNAFDIISLSTGFDLSGLFVGNDEKDEVKFTCKKTASEIISKFEEIAKILKMEVGVKKGGQMKLKKPSEGRTEELSVVIEIFEITDSFHLVEVTKSCGDAYEFHKMLKHKIKPALHEFVWAWHGE
ncbi:hypothetical protein LXL04_035122 [Taraxacum kok-saghyz]